jgi:tripartite-type tricarboxylate transporter receptor subunit TctC
VPLSAGGGSDILARKLARSLSDHWGQSVVVENVPGGSSIIGAQRVAKANPDGYTLMVTTNGTIVANRYLFKTLPYDPDKDLVPVTQLADIDMILLAHSSLPANNLKELVALAKKEPGRSYGSMATARTHLVAQLFNNRENIQLPHVPCLAGPALTSVAAGERVLTLTGAARASPPSPGKTKVLAYMSTSAIPRCRTC